MEYNMKVERKMIHFDVNRNKTVTYRDVTWDEIRRARDAELDQTDWRAVKDRTMSQAWKDHRTALRDLPQVHDEANDAADNWPVMIDE
jgi:hypothetical protein